ncbi:type II secretion system F family protein [Paraburkholderia sp. BL10I2N1]|uniref:type II secretion system F family protein n=1 Tax=Paraburkholderia sp. BL10I2N1 TaxID=1938796 RepID=UPI001060B609|nr:type II secretion system F family protein [Paraburkholderia sp. BL10I2N1]TDN67272.1 Flp pilus assembly protein TadB [Paraburkholderia sp. BL10I2N1]
MTPADVVAAGAFFAILIAGLMVSSLRDMARRRPASRIRSRIDELGTVVALQRKAGPRLPEQELFSLQRHPGRGGAVFSWWLKRVERVHVVSGAGGLRLIAAIAIAILIAALVGVKLASPPDWVGPLIVIGLPLFAVRATYRFLIERFRTRFLTLFPDTLDLIIRAVRAGIPVVQAISTAGREADEPVRSTFRTMGDALRLGADLTEVLDQAVKRLQIADFSFFSVCLLLQRETGGNLAETLENLASIIRSRRDIRLKTKALTAEGRLATNIISAVPFAITGMLYIVNRSYIELLFTTRAGHKIVTLAAVLLTIGLWMVRKMSQLDTSR